MRVVVELIMLDWIAKGWGKNEWTELNLLQKGITVFEVRFYGPSILL